MELSNILELIHAVSDSNLTQFNLQDGNLNISMSAEKTIVQQVAANADAVAFAAQYRRQYSRFCSQYLSLPCRIMQVPAHHPVRNHLQEI